jgi:hypothetical protein
MQNNLTTTQTLSKQQIMQITEQDQFPAQITIWRKDDSVRARAESLRSVTLPDGTVTKLLRDGAVGRFNLKNGEKILKLRFNRKWHVVPTMEDVQMWTLDSACETPDGRMVEPDAPDSWLSLLKLV